MSSYINKLNIFIFKILTTSLGRNVVARSMSFISCFNMISLTQPPTNLVLITFSMFGFNNLKISKASGILFKFITNSKKLAGAPGIEPGMTGSKPVALPLG